MNFALPAATGRGDAMTGNDLLRMCENKRGSTDPASLACLTYVMGLRDAFNIAAREMYPQFINSEYNKKLRVCLPYKVTNGQLAKVLLKYLRAHPEQRHENSYILTAQAMKKAFPCR